MSECGNVDFVVEKERGVEIVTNWAVKMSKQSIWQHHSLILETMEMLVTAVHLTLVLGWTANGPYSTVDKAPDPSQWGTALIDGICIAFEVCQREEAVIIKVKEVFPALVKEGDDFVEYLGNG